MKKVLYLFLSLFITSQLFAQYCGNSGSTQCTAVGLQDPGLYPRSDSLEPFRNGIPSTTVIQFKNFNQVLYSGFTVTVQSLRVDSIENLPAGLCWATDKTNNTYANQENGCIKVNGTPCSAPGQYKLRIKVTVTIAGLGAVPIDAADAGLHYFVRVGNYGDAVPACDTLQTVPFYNVGYSTTTNCSPVLCSSFTFTQSTTTNNSCATPNGSLTVAASGGTAPYTYHLGGSSNSTGTFTQLQGGTYDVIAVDSNACTDTVTVTVPTTTPTITPSVTSSTPQSSCTIDNGAVDVSATGGTGPYTFTLGGNSNSTGSFTGLASGTYTVTVTDANSCPGTGSVTIANTAPVLGVTFSGVTQQTSCVGANGGFTATGTGSSGYTYILGTDTNTTGVFTGLAASSYTVTVVDGAGCTGSGTTTITESLATVTLTTGSTPASSSTATDGSATATGANGLAPYSYLWSDGQTTATATNLLTGNYSVTVTDANGCTVVATLTVGYINGIQNNPYLNTMNIFPNPVSDKLTVQGKLTETVIVNIDVFNTQGQKLMHRNLGQTSGFSETLSLAHLSKGNYLITITTNGKAVTYPVMVE